MCYFAVFETMHFVWAQIALRRFQSRVSEPFREYSWKYSVSTPMAVLVSVQLYLALLHILFCKFMLLVNFVFFSIWSYPINDPLLSQKGSYTHSSQIHTMWPIGNCRTVTRNSSFLHMVKQNLLISLEVPFVFIIEGLSKRCMDNIRNEENGLESAENGVCFPPCMKILPVQ